MAEQYLNLIITQKKTILIEMMSMETIYHHT